MKSENFWLILNNEMQEILTLYASFAKKIARRSNVIFRRYLLLFYHLRYLLLFYHHISIHERESYENTNKFYEVTDMTDCLQPL